MISTVLFSVPNFHKEQKINFERAFLYLLLSPPTILPLATNFILPYPEGRLQNMKPQAESIIGALAKNQMFPVITGEWGWRFSVWSRRDLRHEVIKRRVRIIRFRTWRYMKRYLANVKKRQVGRGRTSHFFNDSNSTLYSS